MIKLLKQFLDKSGKVIISGVGKVVSRQKGLHPYPQLELLIFMDASNASHGDMGQINSNDVVILISLSGSSSELKYYSILFKK